MSIFDSNEQADWKPYRIFPQRVMVRQVTNPDGEVIQRPNGPRLVRQGDYIVRRENGDLWAASKAAFSAAYEPDDSTGGNEL